MKKLKYFAFFAAIALIFSGCTKDEESPKDPIVETLGDLIVGRWNIDEWMYSTTFDGVTDTEVYKNIGTIKFDSDRMGISVITFGGTTETKTFKWSATNKNKLIVDGEMWDVTTVTKSKMVLENNQSAMDMSIESKLTLSRLYIFF